MNEFTEVERAKFEKWFKVYGNPDLCQEAQLHGFLGRAHLARKGQNDPSQLKMYRVTYLDHTGEQTYRRVMAKSPKAAMKMVEDVNPLFSALYAKRPTIYVKVQK